MQPATPTRPANAHRANAHRALRAPWGAALAALLLLAPRPAAAQEPVPDLATLFDLGTLVADTNGDSVPDFVNGSPRHPLHPA